MFLAFGMFFRSGHKTYCIPEGEHAFPNAHTRGRKRGLWFPILFPFHLETNLESKGK